MRLILAYLIAICFACWTGIAFAQPGDWNACFDPCAGGCCKISNLKVTGVLDAQSQNLGTGSVTSTEIADGTIVAGDIATGAVTTTGILDGTIADADMAADTLTAASIAPGAVATSEILDGTILNADVSASAAVAYSKLALTNSIVTGDITTGGVTSTNILDGTILNADVNASAAIAYSKLALTNSIVTGDITTGGVATGNILDGTIAAADLATGSVTAAKLGAGPILNLVYCANQANNSTQYLASATAPAGAKVLANAQDLGNATCDARGSGTEATADEIVSAQNAYKVLGMQCWVESSPGATVTFTARSAIADLTPTVSCTIASGGPVSCKSTATTTTDIAAGATVAVKNVTTTNESAVGALCILTMVAT